MSVAGIDYSTRAIDVVLLDEDTDAASWHRFALAGTDAFERARDVRRALPGRTSGFWDDVLAVGVEDPRGYGAGSLYRVQGAILSCLPAFVLVHPWIPSAWRKAVGLPGNAPKTEVERLVVRLRIHHACDGRIERQASIPSWPQDACDAYCIALATRQALERKQAA